MKFKYFPQLNITINNKYDTLKLEIQINKSVENTIL